MKPNIKDGMKTLAKDFQFIKKHIKNGVFKASLEPNAIMWVEAIESRSHCKCAMLICKKQATHICYVKGLYEKLAFPYCDKHCVDVIITKAIPEMER